MLATLKMAILSNTWLASKLLRSVLTEGLKRSVDTDYLVFYRFFM